LARTKFKTKNSLLSIEKVMSQIPRKIAVKWAEFETFILQRSVGYAGVESFAGGMGVLLERLATENPGAYRNIVQIAAETSELAQYKDSTDHLHIVARKRDA
jgi:hypothetical protein